MGFNSNEPLFLSSLFFFFIATFFSLSSTSRATVPSDSYPSGTHNNLTVCLVYTGFQWESPDEMDNCK